MELALEQKADGVIPPPLMPPPLAPPPLGPQANAMQDFWDINGVPVQAGVNHNAAVPDDFSGLGGSLNSTGRGRWLQLVGYGLLALVLLAAGYVAYLQFVEERDLLAEVQALFHGESDEDEAPMTSVAGEASKNNSGAAPVGDVKKNKSSIVAGNPYWHLPNAIMGRQPAPQRAWTVEEEETWRAGLAHRFSYQRWKTVQEVRQMRLKGSQQILWDALADKKFWTRGYAAVGLAEIGIPIALQNLDAVIQKERSELVADFFERFTHRCNPGQCFVLRQVLKLMDAKGRLVALNGIANSKDSLRDLYLVAATLDPDKRVKRWIRNFLSWQPIQPEKFDALMKIVKGDSSGESLLAGVSMSARSTSNGKGPKQQPSASHLDLQTEEDVDKELEQLDRATESVEFYEAEPAIQDVSDNQTFEYAE